MSSYRIDSFNASSSRPICRYFANGHCFRGASCYYLHIREGSSPQSNNNEGNEQNNHYNSSSNGESSSSTLHKSNQRRSSSVSNSGKSTSSSYYTRHTAPTNSSTNRPAPENLPNCKYFLENRCRFGDSCWYKHEKLEKSDNGTNGISNTNSQNNDMKNQKDKQKAKEVEEEYTCAICYETPKMFGLLVQCDHIFCRDCIKEWRKTSNVSSPFQDVDTTKTCPVCRKNSPYFVPSLLFAKSGPQKEQIISTYKEKISQIPCKYFEKSRKCPFADACFYKHANPDGSRCTLGPPRKKKRSYLSGNIRYMDFSADGEFDISAISEIIDGLQHFNFNDLNDWGDDADGWDDDDEDDDSANEIAHYIAEHHLTRMEVVANEDDDNNVHQWEPSTTDWSANARGWGWDDNVGERGFDLSDNDEECVDWRIC